MSEDACEVRIVLLGKSGSGKSATGNTILGREAFVEDFSSESVTKQCEKHEGEVEGRRVLVVDTPGLFDTSLSNDKVKEEVEKCVYHSVPGPHVFLLVIRLGVRFTKEERDSVKWICENFSKEALKYAMVLFTGGDQLNKPIEDYLKKGTKELKELVDECKGGYHVFKNRERSDNVQVTELLEKIDGMVEQNGGQHYTDEMYQDAQRKIAEEEERKKEEEERKRREQEQKKLEEESKWLEEQRNQWETERMRWQQERSRYEAEETERRRQDMKTREKERKEFKQFMEKEQERYERMRRAERNRCEEEDERRRRQWALREEEERQQRMARAWREQAERKQREEQERRESEERQQREKREIRELEERLKRQWEEHQKCQVTIKSKGMRAMMDIPVKTVRGAAELKELLDDSTSSNEVILAGPAVLNREG